MPLFGRFRMKHSGRPQDHLSTSSANSTVTIIGDRRYRADVPYVFPKDFPEYDRLTFQHFFLKTLLNGNYAAPITNPQRILDVGCGTGIWCREMALDFPSAQIVGFDIEAPALSPSIVTTPSNCLFVQGDLLKGLPFPDQSFDFTFQRLLVGALPAYAWPLAVQELARITSSGGWVECVDAADTLSNVGPMTKKYMQWWYQAGHKKGFDISIITKLDNLLVQAGLQEVKMRVLQVPLGSWGGRGGDLLAKDLHAVFGNLRGMYRSLLKLAPNDIDHVWAALPNEWEEQRTCFHFYLAYGQKP